MTAYTCIDAPVSFITFQYQFELSPKFMETMAGVASKAYYNYDYYDYDYYNYYYDYYDYDYYYYDYYYDYYNYYNYYYYYSPRRFLAESLKAW